MKGVRNRLGLLVLVLVAGGAVLAPAAGATALKLCVPKREGAALRTPTHGRCARGYSLQALGRQGPAGPQGPEGRAGVGASELQTLTSVLPYINFIARGVGGQPTIQFSGANVQIVDGLGSTESINGSGNLVIGYDEDRRSGCENEEGRTPPQEGSHNLIVGTEQEYTSYGDVLAGYRNSATGPFASVTGGRCNSVSNYGDSVTGGVGNKVTAEYTGWVGGGSYNTASGFESSVSGGTGNKAEEFGASITGGNGNRAGYDGTVTGGSQNFAIQGGTVVGGTHNEAVAWLGAPPGPVVLGGRENVAVGLDSVVLGGRLETLAGEYEIKP